MFKKGNAVSLPRRMINDIDLFYLLQTFLGKLKLGIKMFTMNLAKNNFFIRRKENLLSFYLRIVEKLFIRLKWWKIIL